MAIGAGDVEIFASTMERREEAKQGEGGERFCMPVRRVGSGICVEGW